jgi:hypothetical protein
MKPCFRKRKLLAWLALGELDERRARDLRSHVQSCDGCRLYLQEISGLREKLSGAEWSAGVEPSASFHWKWVGRLKAEPTASRWQLVTDWLNWRAALPALGAAAVLVLLALSLLPRQPAHSSQGHRAGAAPPPSHRDLSPSVANYQRVAVRSLDEFDELLTLQAKRHSSPAPTYIASMFAAATSPN